jgi:hypothetical protein
LNATVSGEDSSSSPSSIASAARSSGIEYAVPETKAASATWTVVSLRIRRSQKSAGRWPTIVHTTVESPISRTASTSSAAPAVNHADHSEGEPGRASRGSGTADGRPVRTISAAQRCP